MFLKVLERIRNTLAPFLVSPPKFIDGIILSIFTILITFQPFYTQGKINLFELGIYLPGIQGVLDGMIPFRDVFHLRGPFELYMPALAMKIFGERLDVLHTYFYVGNVICLILCVWILRELLQSRLILYLAVPVIIARTFPRVVYMIWGGMRYAWGLLAIWMIIRFFKTQRISSIFLAGVVTAFGIFTSIEIGAYIIIGLTLSLLAAWIFKIMERSLIVKSMGMFVFGCCVVAIPYLLYLIKEQALIPYVEATLTVVINMQNTFDPHLVSIYPHNFKDAFIAMTNFVHTNFKHMTPSYLYIVLLGFVIWRIRRRDFRMVDLSLIVLGLYGFIMYNTGFRGIWASQFEMALMPEKLLYFFILEWVILVCWTKYSRDDWRKKAIVLFVIIVTCSSIGYAIQRYNHRFTAVKMMRYVLSGRSIEDLAPLKKEESRVLEFPRAQGVRVPSSQADELEAIMVFLKQNSHPTDIIFTYPELGIYNFFADRPFLGRFPIVTFSWMSDKWHQELVEVLKAKKVKYLILQKEMPKDWYQVYLGPAANRKKYDELLTLIDQEFVQLTQTPGSYIYIPRI